MEPISGYLLASAGASAVGAAANYFGGKQQSDANIAMQRETNAQNQAMQWEAWRREDNAVQRRAGDLKNAGMSPVLAAGQGASSSSPIKMDAPQQGSNYIGEAASGAINSALGMSQLSKTDMDNKRTAADIGKIGAETVNTMQNTAASKQNMKIQNIMTAFQTKAISASTMRDLVAASKLSYERDITKIDKEKADVTGVTPSSPGTTKTASDAFNFGKKGLEKINPYAHQQDMMQEYYRKMQEKNKNITGGMHK